MLLAEAREHQLQVRALLCQAGEGDFFARMMDPVRVVAQVRHDVHHQFVVWPFAGVKDVHLPVKQLKELVEIDVLRVPCGDWIDHPGLAVLSIFHS